MRKRGKKKVSRKKGCQGETCVSDREGRQHGKLMFEPGAMGREKGKRGKKCVKDGIEKKGGALRERDHIVYRGTGQEKNLGVPRHAKIRC